MNVFLLLIWSSSFSIQKGLFVESRTYLGDSLWTPQWLLCWITVPFSIVIYIPFLLLHCFSHLSLLSISITPWTCLRWASAVLMAYKQKLLEWSWSIEFFIAFSLILCMIHKETMILEAFLVVPNWMIGSFKKQSCK